MKVCFSLVGVGLLISSSSFAGFFDSNDNNNVSQPNPYRSNNQNVYYYYNDQQQGTVQIDRSNRPGMQPPQYQNQSWGQDAYYQSQPGMQNAPGYQNQAWSQGGYQNQPGMQNAPEYQNQAWSQGGYQNQPGVQNAPGYQNQAWSQGGYQNQPRMQAGYQNQPRMQAPVQRDEDLRRSLNDALTGGMFSKSYKQIQIQVNNGVVTLSGFVETEDDRKDALDRVRKIGVRHIDDRITVQADDEDENSDAISDQDLQKAVNDSIKGNVFAKNFKSVNAQVFNGDVTLTGFVDTEEARSDLVSRVKEIKGVQNVNDRLVIRPAANYVRRSNSYIAQAAPAPATEADRTLNSKVRAALQGGFFSKGYEDILTDVRNGVVTLRGTVASESDHKTVIDRVQKLDGVERLDNQIQIQPSK